MTSPSSPPSLSSVRGGVLVALTLARSGTGLEPPTLDDPPRLDSGGVDSGEKGFGAGGIGPTDDAAEDQLAGRGVRTEPKPVECCCCSCCWW